MRNDATDCQIKHVLCGYDVFIFPIKPHNAIYRGVINFKEFKIKGFFTHIISIEDINFKCFLTKFY